MSTNSSELREKDDPEIIKPKLKYPRAIPFIVLNEFCERFNYYGMRTVLALYLTIKLGFDPDTATIIYHSETTFVYFCCLFGAIIADSWLGKFKTILILSCVYVCGSTILTLGAIETLYLPRVEFTIVGLVLIASGSGGIKPCVAAFGGEQFTLPEQAKHLALFFSFFYFSINAGSLISTFITPILRSDVHCFGSEDCYPLAFGVPAVLMFTSIVVFVIGKFMYKIYPPQGNMFARVCLCIGNAIKNRFDKTKRIENPKHGWLSYAEEAYGTKLVLETKILLNILVLYLPLPMFWALFDQQGSRWTFQATRMNGDIGFMTIRPDQIQVLNPFLILIFIPLYEVAFYPVLNLIGIRRPLQKLTLGGIFGGIAFILSAIIEIQLDSNPDQPMSILWQIPQYVVLTLGEVMFSVTGLQFSFTQAPESMKSVLQGCWQLTVAFGNLIVVFLVGINIFPQQSSEFLLFAGLMFIDMGVFAILAYYYKPIPLEELEKVDNNDADDPLKMNEKAPIEEKTKL